VFIKSAPPIRLGGERPNRLLAPLITMTEGVPALVHVRRLNPGPRRHGGGGLPGFVIRRLA
jgi:hypothetical protein